MYSLGKWIEKHRDHIPTAGEIAKEMNGEYSGRSTSSDDSHITSSLQQSKLPAVVISRLQPVPAHNVGEKAALRLYLQNNTGSAQMMTAVWETGFHASSGDPIQEKAIEEELWQRVQARERKSSPSLVPSHGAPELLSVGETGALRPEDMADIEAGRKVPYFAALMKDTRDQTILEFCGYINRDNAITYCKYHNGP